MRKESLAGKIRRAAEYTAKTSVGKSTFIGIYEPKVPAALKNAKKEK